MSDKKNLVHSSSKTLCGFIVICLISGVLFFSSSVVFADTPMYIPSAPTGPSFGYVGIDYEYTIVTLNPDSYWMFDWGDGTNTSWMQLEHNRTSITETHQWDAVGTYQVHVKYKSDTTPQGVWSDAKMVEITTYSSYDFPNPPILSTGKIQGFNNTVYTYSAVTTDPSGYPVCYRFGYGNGTFSDWTPCVPSGTSSYVSFSWESPGVYELRTQARNQNGLESAWSDPVEIIIYDTATATGASMDLVVLNTIPYHIIYTSEHEGTFYNPATGSSTDILWVEGGMFLVDDDGDGRWEYLYSPSIGQIQPYDEPSPSEENSRIETSWLLVLIILIIVFGVVGVFLVLLRTGYLYVYEEEVDGGE
ncbi:MAG: hypothetical protein WC525_01795 [Candidatus Thermoplasmatota archaeon]